MLLFFTVVGAWIVWGLRRSSVGHRITDVAVMVGVPGLAGLAVLDSALTAADAPAGDRLRLWVSSGLLVLLALAIVVRYGLSIRAREMGAATRKSTQNFNAFMHGVRPDWVSEMADRLDQLDTNVAAIGRRKQVPVRAASLREWWRLRPSWRGPHETE